MLNEIKSIDVGTATEDCSDLDDSSEEDRYNVFNGEIYVRPSGSRTLDNRLNPDAPDFVPGLSARLLAVKIVDELTTFPKWSNASDDIVSYGPRYNSIWRESCPRTQEESENRIDLEPLMQLSNVIEIVGDVEPSLSQRSKVQSEPEIESISTGRCCSSCALM